MPRLSGSDNAALFAEDRLRVRSIMERPKWKSRAKMQAIWNYILSREVIDGTHFLIAETERLPYVVLGRSKQVIALHEHGRGADTLLAYLHVRFGLNEHEAATRFVYDAWRMFTIASGERVDLRRFAVYNEQTQCAYLSNYDGTMWRLNGAEVERVDNGEDGVFFVDDDGGVPSEPDINPHGILLDTLAAPNFSRETPGGMLPEQQRRALIMWMFIIALPDLMPTKPILILEGVKGSGKTSAVSQLQMVLMGHANPFIIRRNKEDEFGIMILRSPIAILDNIDVYIDWLPNALAAYATGAGWTSRKLYTDDQRVTIRPQSFIAVASKNPISFRQSDVPDRSVILRLDRRPKFDREGSRIAQARQNRPKLLGEYMWFLNRVVHELKTHGFAEESEQHRMADFTALARVIGRVMGWTDEEINETFRALQREREAFVGEEDSLVEVLHKWIAYRPKAGPSNVGRDITIFQLFSELETVAQVNNLPFYRSHKILQQQLREPHVERDFIVQEFNVGGHKSYRIWRRTDPQLSLVPEGDIVIEE